MVPVPAQPQRIYVDEARDRLYAEGNDSPDWEELATRAWELQMADQDNDHETHAAQIESWYLSRGLDPWS